MEFELIRPTAISLMLHLAFGVLAIFVGAIAIKVTDYVVLRKINLEEEIGRGNLAAAVVTGALWISLAIILSSSR